MQSIFGTDGIRGKFNKDINYLLASKIGYSLGKIINLDQPILIGRDTRNSGEILLEALTHGLNASNKNIIDIGVCPTPAVAFLIKELNCSSGIMISASHNPPEYNGIKFFDSNGKKFKKNREYILEKSINEINEIDLSIKNSRNNIKNFDLIELYEKSLIKSIEDENLDGIKIILDTCHGSATSCAENVFKKLGANTKVINSNPDGSKINVRCGSTYLDPLKAAILENEADMGFSFDGDADRVIAVDSNCNVMDGDHILFLWGRELMENKMLSRNILISTDMANLGFENLWNKIGGIFYRTKVGDKFIHEALLKQKADLGGEQSGHILSKINNYSGDGILTAIQISKFCKQKKITLKTWLNSSFSAFPQKLTNIYLNKNLKSYNYSIKNNINQSIDEILQKIDEPCRIFVRPSGTEPLLRVLVEAENKKLVENCTIAILERIEKIIKNQK